MRGGGMCIYICRWAGSGARCGCPVAGWEEMVNVVCLGGYEGWFFGGC